MRPVSVRSADRRAAPFGSPAWRRVRRATAALVVGCCLLDVIAAPAVRAQQQSFAQQPVGNDVRYSYAYRDAEGVSRHVSFQLSSTDIEAAMVLFRDYSIPQLYGYIEAALEREARKAGVILQSRRVGEGASFGILADTAAKRDAFSARMDDIIARARQEWLTRQARRAVGTAIHLDYSVAAHRYVTTLKPVAKALSAQAAGNDDERARVGRALNFVQSIPYDDLIDPRTTGGIEFAPPPAMFKINRGDCDSKTVALAAILRTMTPGRRIVFVTLPQHVALAIDLPPHEGDAAVMYDGRPWLMLEPTGPAVVAPGQVAPTTAWYIERPGEIVYFEMKE